MISKKSDKLIISIVAALLLIAISIFGYSVYLQNQTINQQNNLKELIINNDQNINNEQINQYITNQENLKDMWWHTIINQSGLSIITTLIVLLITASIGYLYKSNMDKEYKLELEKMKQRNNKFIRELIILQNNQGEISSGMSGPKTSEKDIKLYVRRINSVDRLNQELEDIVKENDTSFLIETTIQNFIKESVIHKMNYNNSAKSIVFFFNQIKNNMYKNKIINCLIIEIKSLKKQDGKENILKHCKELLDLLQKEVI